MAPSTPPRSLRRSNSERTASSTSSVSSVDDEGALVGVLVRWEAPLALDDELDGHGAAHAINGGRSDGLVVGVGVQAVAVVVDGDEACKRGADVVEVDLLRVQAAAAGLDVVLELLAALVGAIAVRIVTAQMRRATRPSTLYSGSMPLLKKN